ncbi:hypothetical protein EN739_24460 [Mesorhizobium sp. M2A.F.Ca.ET.017.03.2.1]|uniref:hypothetical protein n=1 Tax=unclassified Mesorhizobium TaxID=325217 RepID=UPI000FCB702D|nr:MULTISPECIES: hypothetical protein [unclassified Mesorhizobium]RUW39157.1 hypothetical protein EOA37_21135 [Mesorhizobium sp. M2A.F.Ca.ET.015.02.1.1]RVC92718.1 hypothetical protein EN739_24460 [Mesorhizobium sp. M2A.F.Ca.ET.017.03.2.1]
MNWSPAMRATRREKLQQPQLSLLDQDVLNFDLFAGDRDANVRLIENRMVVTRKVHDCVLCGEGIPVKSRVRAQSECDRSDNKVMTFYVCEPCCRAIGLSYTDNGEALEQRMHRRRVA